ncbi:hypothetical protein HDK77DRAFT_310127 [Phyllosticta capitalensis]|uniref:uncharacterized protein n=1 Tax=Phyllosticta capitalensis TaxID=121624 RepID=UPI00312F858E
MARRSTAALSVALLFSLIYLLGGLRAPRSHPFPGLYPSCISDPQLSLRAHYAKTPSHQKNTTIRHLFGLRDLLDDDSTKCYNVSNRLRAYGYHDDDLWWSTKDWGQAQTTCARKNGLLHDIRYRKPFHLPDPVASQVEQPLRSKLEIERKNRTAVVLRTTDAFNWAGDIKAFIRSMIVELSLESGGIYELFILVQVKNSKDPIFLDPKAYDRVLRKSVPKEFQSITYLWNENLLKAWYPAVPEHSYIHQAYQSLQLFSETVAADFEYFWQFEMDFRTSSPHLQNLERIAMWAREQPRLYLQQMNSAWYIPSLMGSWGDLWQLFNETLWDDDRAAEVQAHGTKWGVGEEADLITLAPIVDVRSTNFWLFRGMVHNDPFKIKEKKLPHFAAPVAMTRTSKRLLHEVHVLQQRYGFWMATEATMETIAFRKGLKAVHAKHPLYYNGTENDSMLDWLFNSGGPQNLGGGADSVYNWEGAPHKVLEKLSWFWPRVGYTHYAQLLWSDFLRQNTCVPAGLFHPFKWDMYVSPEKYSKAKVQDKKLEKGKDADKASPKDQSKDGPPAKDKPAANNGPAKDAKDGATSKEAPKDNTPGKEKPKDETLAKDTPKDKAKPDIKNPADKEPSHATADDIPLARFPATDDHAPHLDNSNPLKPEGRIEIRPKDQT